MASRDEVVAVVSAASGRGVLCNRPSNGLEAIEQFGAEHVAGGDLIVYTSQDSVLQIAAHVDVRGARRAVRDLRRRCGPTSPPEHAVGRVIARPFAGAEGGYDAHRGRRDFALAPPSPQLSRRARGPTGCRSTRSARSGSCSPAPASTSSTPGATNARALAETTELIGALESGSCSPT